MKACILTIHNVPNYGAVCQAWALRHAVQSLGHTCDVIDYRPAASVEFYRQQQGRFPMSLLRRYRAQKFDRFVSANLLDRRNQPLFDSEAVFKQIREYDVVICGSDQIWHTGGFRGIDETFFLGGANLNNTRKVAFAASVGSSQTADYADVATDVRSWLEDFDMIGVRDTPTASLVANLTGRSAELVCDPTLLPTSRGLLLGAPKDQPIAVIYGGAKKRDRGPLREFADRARLKLVAIGCQGAVARRAYPLIGPQAWLRWIGSSQLVITGFFHGVQLAILGQKPFAVIARPEKKQKIMDCLDHYGAQDRWLTPDRPLSQALFDSWSEDIGRVETKRVELADRSMAFLERALA